MKILFITTRNVATASGELSLIKSRALNLKKEFNINSIFLSYINKYRKEKKSEEGIHNTFDVKYITYEKDKPWSFFFNQKKL